MPIITVYGPANRSKETKKELIENISKVVSEAYEMPISTIHVNIIENPPDNVGVGGKQLSEINKSI